jgi:hypothetical protein
MSKAGSRNSSKLILLGWVKLMRYGFKETWKSNLTIAANRNCRHWKAQLWRCWEMRRLGSVTARSGCFSWLGIRSSLLWGWCWNSDRLFTMDLYWRMPKLSLNVTRFLRRLVKWLLRLSRPIGRPLSSLLWIFHNKVGKLPMLRLRKMRLGCSKKLA